MPTTERHPLYGTQVPVESSVLTPSPETTKKDTFKARVLEKAQAKIENQKKLDEYKKRKQKAREDAVVEEEFEVGISSTNPPDVNLKAETTPTKPPEGDKDTEHETLKTNLGKSVGEEITEKVKIIKESGDLDSLSPEEKESIQREICFQSLQNTTDLSEEVRGEIQKQVISRLEGKTPEEKEIEWKKLSEEKQKELILESPEAHKITDTLLDEYNLALKKPENVENGKLKDAVLSELAKKHLGTDTLPTHLGDALSLSVLKNKSGAKLRDEASIEIAERILTENGFQEMIKTIGETNITWDNLPPAMRLQLIGSDKFEYDKSILEKNPQFAADRGKAIEEIKQKQGETPEQYKKRMETEYGITEKTTPDTVQAAIQQVVSQSGDSIDTSNISPFMRFLMDIFAAIGALLPGETGDMCRAYLSKSDTSGTNYANSGSSGSGRHNGISGEGIPESSGEAGEVSGELADMGFRGNVMDSIWKWEYQPGHKAEVVPAGKSGFTLCGGIDLAYTPFSDVQSIFAGVLKPETIQKLKPFSYHGRTGPIRGTAQNLLSSSPGLLNEINSQLDEGNMGTAFSRSLAKDWARLVAKYPAAKGAPGYIQTIMLSRFYHDGSGGSSDIVSAIVQSNFDHNTVVNRLQSRRTRRSASYYRNRIDKEIAYVGKRPPDSKPTSATPETQPSSNEPGETDNEKLAGNSGVKWFEENAGKSYGKGRDRFDCMTSTHAALGVSAESLGSSSFGASSILREGKETDLWNVSTAAARYSGVLPTDAPVQKRISKDSSGYYGGVRAQNPGNLEYYIEENVMKRTQDSSNGIVDVGGKGKLIHYSKSKKGINSIVEDIKTRLISGTSAMMGATGNGTNIGGHEWLLHNDNGTLKVYESTNFENKGVSGKGIDLGTYLQHERRSKYPNEALIFAKRA